MAIVSKQAPKHIWTKLYEKLGPSWLGLGGSITLSTLSFTVLQYLLYLVHKKGWFKKHKIQGEKFPEGALLKEAIEEAVKSQLLSAPTYVFVHRLLMHKGMIVKSKTFASLRQLLLSLLYFIATTDTLFYWCHRTLHHKSIYGKIHKKHHRFKTNVGPAAVYAHPIENATNFIATVIGPLTITQVTGMKLHVTTLWVWMVLRWMETIDAHSGFDFPFSPFRLFRVAEHHDFHHSHNIGCYGSFFGFWDWVCGTDAAFKKFKAKQLQLRTEKKGDSK